MAIKPNKFRDKEFDIARGEYFKDVRLEQLKQKEKKPDEKYQRCPSCGGMVLMPCVLCQPEKYTSIEGYNQK